MRRQYVEDIDTDTLKEEACYMYTLLCKIYCNASITGTPEWYKIDELISRIEDKQSRHSD